MTVDELAEDLYVDPGDIRVLLAQLDPATGGLDPDEQIPNEYAADIRDQLNHFCERTVPAVWWPGSDPDAGSGATKMR